jgi:chromosome segregation ATPase
VNASASLRGGLSQSGGVGGLTDGVRALTVSVSHFAHRIGADGQPSNADVQADLDTMRRRLANEQRQKQSLDRRCMQLEQELQLTRAELVTAQSSQSDLMGRMETEMEGLRARVRSGGDLSQMVELLQHQIETLQSELNAVRGKFCLLIWSLMVVLQTRKKLVTETATRRRMEEGSSALEQEIDSVRHALSVAETVRQQLEEEATALRQQTVQATESRLHSDELYKVLTERYTRLEAQNASLRTRSVWLWVLLVPTKD